MKTTGNLGLKKPDGTDIVDIADLNGNMDILDTAVKAVQDHTADAVKHLTAAERTAWNAKASAAAATTAAAGLMAAADKAKLDGVAAGANAVANSAANGVITINGVNATVYTHPNHTGDVTSTGDGVTAIAPGVIVDADVNSAAAIAWSKLSKTGASLADLPTRSAADLTSGTLSAARLPAISGDITMAAGAGTAAITAGAIVNADVNASAAIDAAKIGTGVVSNAEFGYLDGVTSGIQGQLNGKANLTTTPQQTTADITYYVRPDGNDGNTGLANTAGGAFKTIGKAIGMIPKVVNHTATVNVGAGTYAEAISLRGFGGEGVLNVIGETTTRIVQRVEIINCTIVTTVDGFTCNTISLESISIRSSTAAVVNQVNSTVSATNQSGIVINLAMVRLTACVISNKGRVISAVNGGKAYAENFSGTGNVFGYVAELGGHISYAGTQAISTGGNVAGTSGIVNSEVLNPWGDNTFPSRSFIYATHTVQQNLSPNVLTKIVCNMEGNDNLGEYNPVTGVFTAKTSGVYLVTAAIQFTNVVSGGEIKLGVGAASGASLFVSHIRPGSSGYGAVSGAVSMGMEAGGTLALWAISTSSVATNPDPSYSYVIITRIA